MADNYLERKMEDLRTGKLHNYAPLPSGIRSRNNVSFPMPKRRVLLISVVSKVTQSIAAPFVKAGCKVAVLTPQHSEGEKMALTEGIRFIPGSENWRRSIQSALDNLYKAWRGVDILITPDLFTLDCGEVWESYIKKYPFPSDFTCRLIILATKPTSPSDLSFEKINLNTIIYPDDPIPLKPLADTALFLSTTAAGRINNSYINLI